jgi:hypothetical protein
LFVALHGAHVVVQIEETLLVQRRQDRRRWIARGARRRRFDADDPHLVADQRNRPLLIEPRERLAQRAVRVVLLVCLLLKFRFGFLPQMEACGQSGQRLIVGLGVRPQNALEPCPISILRRMRRFQAFGMLRMLGLLPHPSSGAGRLRLIGHRLLVGIVRRRSGRDHQIKDSPGLGEGEIGPLRLLFRLSFIVRFRRLLGRFLGLLGLLRLRRFRRQFRRWRRLNL